MTDQFQGNKPSIVDRLAASADTLDLVGQIREWIKNSAGVHFTTKAEQAEIDDAAAKALPEITDRAALDALAPGAAYIDGLGVRRVK